MLSLETPQPGNRIRFGAMRCDAKLCAREKERFRWLVFSVSPAVSRTSRASRARPGLAVVFCNMSNEIITYSSKNLLKHMK